MFIYLFIFALHSHSLHTTIRSVLMHKKYLFDDDCIFRINIQWFEVISPKLNFLIYK